MDINRYKNRGIMLQLQHYTASICWMTVECWISGIPLDSHMGNDSTCSNFFGTHVSMNELDDKLFS